MIVELGHYSLVLALALAIVGFVLPLIGALRHDAQLMAVAPSATVAQFVFVAISFAVLTHAYLVSDFSVANVVENSHSMKPLIFKISGVWGNHEGSMLLWVLILALFGALVALFGRNLPLRLKALVLSIQSLIGVAFLFFILATSNPFLRLSPAPIEGRDLNPILQDIGLAIHPPLLYLGYVGCSISFSFAIAALIDGRIDAAWARWVRPWTLAAWVFLTLGIAMGSYWAYYELGWGGWWFWDPVENASFMPWLAATALLHSAIVMEKRDALKIWTILLAILAFSLSLLGTFLVRSGVLTSVHAFASDPTRGVFILGILCVFIGGGLALFAARAPSLAPGGVFAPISREGALVFNNLILTAACATVLTGTLYPLVLEALTGGKISVGAPFFDMTFGPLMVPLLIAVPFGPLLAWKRGDLLAASQRLMAAFLVALAVIVIGLFLAGTGSALAILGIALAAWLLVGSLSDIAFRVKLGRAPLAESVRRGVGLPRAAWGTMVAHFGLGLTVLGIVASTAWNSETIVTMKPGDSVEVAGRTLAMDGFLPVAGGTYTGTAVRFSIREGGAAIGTLQPEKRFYTVQNMPTTESAIRTFGFSQLYVSLGDVKPDGETTVRVYWKSLITLIWLGALVMAAGGTLSLSDRRLRVGAPKPARRAVPVAAE
ncbi:cytochrome c-type biogenesis protein CcmF [Kaistia hirudinis]|uniref:Cytochrome c-type biogenesis protein CcmF n=1 Tax=Kaistia hirudinis TaxID=1293440 RepID=A0A840AQK8_9HYPH|nr:heme lyase CcmF/NrfE family subunit [Kaistia hirudinis]MBB3930755.1 cytochrome c-type biogenesis protein CcmF [Kaistia hirudinis]